ncbi:SpoIID/LytB domain-containing protein [bacterium]|nr:SpoIID/LytB domain-containing protein [bacterium]
MVITFGTSPSESAASEAASEEYYSEINITGIPQIRVGILEGYERVDFRLLGNFRVEDLDGNVIFSNLNSGLKWRTVVEEAEPADISHRVLIKSFSARQDAEQFAEQLRSNSYPAKVMEMGKIVKIDGRLVNDTRRYRVVLGDFKRDSECTAYMEEFDGDYFPQIIRIAHGLSSGVIEFYDAEYDYSAKVDNGFRIIPEDEESCVKIYGVRIGTGFHWEETENRIYSGIIEFRLDLEGQLMVVNEVGIDEYLMGVVPAEMPSSFPLEALKAQAVAARSEVLSKLGTRHLNDPFDFCATVHCQVYSGLTNRSSAGDQAVRETQGEAISLNGRICEAAYSSVCGGHTENKENVWNTPGESYLVGLFDSFNTYNDSINLTQEIDIHKWIDARPKVYCNIDSFDTSPALNGSKKYFRWEETYIRQELEEIIREKTGADIGTLFGIEPIKRGNSGRLIEIELLGSIKNLRIKRELTIRRSLSRTHLKSSCFYVTEEVGPDSVPVQFTFHGAGWGHGVGMCQVGAAVMAQEGYNYQQILEHYYKGIMLKKIYSIRDNTEY